MDPFHIDIIKEIDSLVTEQKIPLEIHGDPYVGTTKPVYFLKAVDIRKIFANFQKRHPEMTSTEFTDLLDSLSQGKTYNEFVAIGLLLGKYPHLRRIIDPFCLDRWLEFAEGWAEVDVICQLNFTAVEMLERWETWQKLLNHLVQSENVHKRRASLVLLTKPLRESEDPRLAELALSNIETLKAEKHILITKAVSWVLRSMIKHHRSEVERYLDENAASLPKVAVRETRNKLVGGVKKKTAGV